MTNKRKVKIEGERQRRGGALRGFEADERSDLGPVRRVDRNAPLTIPTNDHRHMSHIREGRISFEVFSRVKRALIPVDADVQEGGREDDHADQELREGSAESVPRDDKAVRQEKGKTSVLRDGKQTRSRKKPESKGQQRVPKAKEEINVKAAKARKKTRVTKRERKHGPGLGG